MHQTVDECISDNEANHDAMNQSLMNDEIEPTVPTVQL